MVLACNKEDGRILSAQLRRAAVEDNKPLERINPDTVPEETINRDKFEFTMHTNKINSIL